MCARKRIAVIDDDLDTLVLIHSILAQNYEIATSNNPKQAVEFIMQNQPNLILLDLAMPEVDGWDVFNQLKREERTSDIPVIIITASHDKVNQVFGLHIAHVANYLTKPFTIEGLLDGVAKALESSPVD